MIFLKRSIIKMVKRQVYLYRIGFIQQLTSEWSQNEDGQRKYQMRLIIKKIDKKFSEKELITTTKILKVEICKNDFLVWFGSLNNSYTQNQSVCKKFWELQHFLRGAFYLYRVHRISFFIVHCGYSRAIFQVNSYTTIKGSDTQNRIPFLSLFQNSLLNKIRYITWNQTIDSNGSPAIIYWMEHKSLSSS